MIMVLRVRSAENTYVSLAHLLNPKHDKKKKREIHEKGLLIQRKYLTLGSVIGHGNFGCVYEGYLQRRSSGSNTSDDDQRVAVKTLLDPVTHAIDLQGFINEALLMKDFDHDHVLGLLGLSEGDRGLPLVVLPFMPRGDLLTYVKDENMEMTVGDVLRFCTDIASGMEYLAGQKLVHRDLAARNCMLDDDLRVKVADFGLCRDVYEKGYYHSDNKKKLPIRWMAIESIEKGTYSSKSDVWSLGVVVWELTTRGITPYPGVEGWDILRYLLAGRRLDQPLLCPDPLYALMERCWDEKPIKRPPFHELKQNLESFTKALETPAATNALCLDTKIVIPRCHRFRDDAAVMEKVLMGMRKLEMKQAAASLTKDRLSTNDQLPTTDLLPAKDRRSTKKRRSPRADRPDTTAATSIPEITVTQAEGVTVKSSVNGGAKPEHLESLEMQDRNQSRKDDSYFVLEK
nr:hypothetical protein BaRGS_030617 [Batillaria attramentaria]